MDCNPSRFREYAYRIYLFTIIYYYHTDIIWLLLFLGRIDLWTRNSSGCKCEQLDQLSSKTDEDENYMQLYDNLNKENDNCACCVKGGCQCGPTSSRCGQCGLEIQCFNSKLILKWLILKSNNALDYI